MRAVIGGRLVCGRCFAFFLVAGRFLFLRMVGGRCLNQYMVGDRWLMVGGLWLWSVAGRWFCTTTLRLRAVVDFNIPDICLPPVTMHSAFIPNLRNNQICFLL